MRQTYHCKRVAQQDESRGVVGKVIADFFEGLINCLIFVLADLVGVFINHIWWVGVGH